MYRVPSSSAPTIPGAAKQGICSLIDSYPNYSKPLIRFIQH